MRYLLAIIFLLLSNTTFASERSYSVTVKPGTSIVGTTSFNIHSDMSVTVLVYESASKITESQIILDAKASSDVAQLIEEALTELVNLEDYSQLTEYKQTSAISVSHNKVTKSISTRRYTDQLIVLIKTVNRHIPKEHQIQLEMK